MEDEDFDLGPLVPVAVGASGGSTAASADESTSAVRNDATKMAAGAPTDALVKVDIALTTAAAAPSTINDEAVGSMPGAGAAAADAPGRR